MNVILSFFRRNSQEMEDIIQPLGLTAAAAVGTTAAVAYYYLKSSAVPIETVVPVEEQSLQVGVCLAGIIDWLIDWLIELHLLMICLTLECKRQSFFDFFSEWSQLSTIVFGTGWWLFRILIWGCENVVRGVSTRSAGVKKRTVFGPAPAREERFRMDLIRRNTEEGWVFGLWINSSGRESRQYQLHRHFCEKSPRGASSS